ncbi:(Fe-S)-binding protein [Deinococcus cellulosilyticus]|uniref:Iron-sulfur-binding protein n=1 Tax=Deinococcus cellulosilyticus (strain DSM 18568 / NBRC 106333 / KACC 11606 / 5516J-15) TaxID=1223518 RepID=A0A511MWB3_DEIC1|nr:(Fe-S)-binding protein [Deinococcus cellulosilyticus]GEM44869.1 iron-sulfur-binding protein [Deinococcus cellulosilyticus NBRC 106333 = KACC 11606]
MLPTLHQVLFALFGLLAIAVSLKGFRQVYANIRSGRDAVELRFNEPVRRLLYSLATTLTQSRVFRKRPLVSFFHSLIMYGFTFYLLVNLIDFLEGYFHLEISSGNPIGAIYNLLADLLSLGVLLGVISLSIRRFSPRGKRVFSWNQRTLLHPKVLERYISRDSVIVSSFILFHVGCRILGQGFKLIYFSEDGQYRDAFQPLASSVAGLLSSLGVTPETALSGFAFGYWGALGSILLFLSYFPYSKHIHLFMAPVKYAVKRFENSGTIPLQKVDLEAEELKMGAQKMSDLEWPRLVDAYACIQCNRCQDVCPGTQTGKALSPAAMEINKRMAFNAGQDDVILLDMVISPDAVWACTTCGACMDVCPVQNEQMLDIIDIRRHQVLVEGDFPQELNMAFRGMERAGNPWGISQDKRMDWAQGLHVPTIDQNPNPDVLYWVGCAAAYDPGAQKVARSFVQLLERAKVNFAVLGKKETCTGDSARRAGNELLFQQLAERNISNLNAANARLIVTTCPHCMNTLKNEYPQLGGNYQVIHHTEYLEKLLNDHLLEPIEKGGEVTFHDPCYLGRHNGIYDAPRDVLKSMGATVLELERTREKSFCCGAGGAQFWKEEEDGELRISEARFMEIQRRLDQSKEGNTVAVGCPFCKSMLNSSPSKADTSIEVKDVAELLLERVTGKEGAEPLQQPELQPQPAGAEATPAAPQVAQEAPIHHIEPVVTQEEQLPTEQPAPARKKWGSKTAEVAPETSTVELPAEIERPTDAPAGHPAPTRKKWGSKPESAAQETPPLLPGSNPVQQATSGESASSENAPVARKKWGADKQATPDAATPVIPESENVSSTASTEAPSATEPATRKKWGGKKEEPADPSGPQVVMQQEEAPQVSETPRKKWGGAAKQETPEALKAPVSHQPSEPQESPAPTTEQVTAEPLNAPSVSVQTPARKKWGSKSAQQPVVNPEADQRAVSSDEPDAPENNAEGSPPEGRKKWKPRKTEE